MKEEKAREFLESKGISPDKIYLREPHFPAVDFVRLLVEYANQHNQQSDKTVEQRALELYPPDLVAYGIAATDEDDLVFDNNDAARRAYIKGATDNQNK